jgi:hypothetical protein
MRIDNLQQYIRLCRELTNERDAIKARLKKLNEALGDQTRRPQGIQVSTGGLGRRPAAGISLKNLVIEVLSAGPRTKEEVLEAVQQRGYRFSTNNPLNSLGVILYGKNPKFNRIEGRFSVGGGVSQKSTDGKRQMSAAGRARIAEAQRKRWATARKARNGSSNGSPRPAQRHMSPAARKRIAEAAKKRWAAAKAAGKSSL